MSYKDQIANRQDVIQRVAEEAGVSLSQAKLLVDATLESIVWHATNCRYVQLREFGKFEMRHRAARLNKRPLHGGPPREIPAHYVMHFTNSPGIITVAEPAE